MNFNLVPILLILGSLISSKSLAQDYENYLESLLEQLGVNSFYIDQRKIESYKSVAYANEESYTVKRFKDFWPLWKNFKYKVYRGELKDKLAANFSLTELQLVEKTFRNGFYAKIIKDLMSYDEYLKLYNDLIVGNEFLIFTTDERRQLLKEIFDYYGLVITEQNLMYRLSLLGRVEEGTIEVKYLLSGKKYYINSKDLENFKRNTKRLLFHLLAIKLYKYSDHDLRSFLRRVKGPIHRRFTQLLINYHYLFLMDFILQNEKKAGLITVAKASRS